MDYFHVHVDNPWYNCNIYSQACPGKKCDCPDMTIAVDWDVKYKTQANKQTD